MPEAISVTREGDQVTVCAPYYPAFQSDAHKINGNFDKSTLLWSFDADAERRVYALCMRHFGTDGTPTELVTFRLPLDRWNRKNADKLWLFGRLIAYRSSYNSRVQLGDGVELVEGDFPTSGGTRTRPAIAAEEGTVLEIRGVPAAHPDLERYHEIEITDRSSPTVDVDSEAGADAADVATTPDKNPNVLASWLAYVRDANLRAEIARVGSDQAVRDADGAVDGVPRRTLAAALGSASQNAGRVRRIVNTSPPETPAPSPLPTIYLLGAGVDESTWGRVEVAMHRRGWVTISDHIAAWYLAQAGTPVVLCDFSAPSDTVEVARIRPDHRAEHAVVPSTLSLHKDRPGFHPRPTFLMPSTGAGTVVLDAEALAVRVARVLHQAPESTNVSP